MHLFVYGTLLAAADTPMARWLASRLGEIVAAHVPGRLVAIPTPHGWYPALLPGRGGQRVSGMVCETDFGPGDLVRLDRYEGREYVRRTLLVRTRDGRRLGAQVYRWRTALPADSRPIRHGDFLAWLKETRQQPFSARRNGS